MHTVSKRKTEFDTLCKLSPLETICMKCQILFSGKNKKNNTNVSPSPAEIAQCAEKVNQKKNMKCKLSQNLHEMSNPVSGKK